MNRLTVIYKHSVDVNTRESENFYDYLGLGSSPFPACVCYCAICLPAGTEYDDDHGKWKT